MGSLPSAPIAPSETPDETIRRLTAELHEALEQQAATTEILEVINSSPGDLAPIFDAILQKALRLCGATHGHVFTIEREVGRAVAARGEPEFVEWLLQREPVRPGPGSIAYRMAQGESVIQIPDSTDTDEYRARTDLRELIDKSGVRTTLGIALRSEKGLLGVIFVNRREVRPFSEKQIALLENFAAQAVIAMENARLLTETREALEQQTATAEVLQVINSSPGDLTPVFDTILEKAHTLCGAAHGIMMIREEEKFRTVAFNGVRQAFVDAIRQLDTMRPPDGSGPARLIQGEQIVHFPDLQAESFLQNARPQLRRAIEIGDVRTTLMVPLRKDGAVIGIITAF